MGGFNRNQEFTNLSIVIYGEIRPGFENCVAACLSLFPKAEIIISTWKPDDDGILYSVKNSDRIQVCHPEDPGAIEEFGGKTVNILRAFRLFDCAAQLCQREFIIKIRSDFVPTKHLPTEIAKWMACDWPDDPPYFVVDYVGNTIEPFKISDFTLFSKAYHVRDFAKKAHDCLADDQVRQEMARQLSPYSHLYSQKMHKEIAPAEVIGLLAGIGAFDNQVNLNAEIGAYFQKERQWRKQNIGTFKIKSFKRPERLEIFTSYKTLFRFLRGQIRPSSLLGRCLDGIYRLRRS